jgi:hypothetical protein
MSHNFQVRLDNQFYRRSLWMNFSQAADDYLTYLEVEKNYSENTIRGYAFDLKCYEDLNFIIRILYGVFLLSKYSI